MRPIAILILALAEMVSWRIVARHGRANEWNLMLAVFIAQGIVGAVAWHPRWSPDVAPTTSIWLGLVCGAALYGGTRAFVLVAGRLSLFREHVAANYAQARLAPLPLAVVLAVFLAVPGEELFWRGFVQGFSGAHTSELAAVAITLIGYIAAKAASASLPLVAAGVVGGLVWGTLTALTGGILAALLCHGLWTGLMLVLPPAAGRADAEPREMMPA
jgi:membrane protease YdiL (CAAX protease family)